MNIARRDEPDGIYSDLDATPNAMDNFLSISENRPHGTDDSVASMEGLSTGMGDISLALVEQHSKLPPRLQTRLHAGSCSKNCRSSCLLTFSVQNYGDMLELSTTAHELKDNARQKKGESCRGGGFSIRSSGVGQGKRRKKSNDTKLTVATPSPSNELVRHLTPSAYQPLGKRIDFLGTSRQNRRAKYHDYLKSGLLKLKNSYVLLTQFPPT